MQLHAFSEHDLYNRSPVGQVGNLQAIGNRLGRKHETGQADCQSAAG